MTMNRRRCHTHKSLSAPTLGALALDRIAQLLSPLQLLAKQQHHPPDLNRRLEKGRKEKLKAMLASLEHLLPVFL